MVHSAVTGNRLEYESKKCVFSSSETINRRRIIVLRATNNYSQLWSIFLWGYSVCCMRGPIICQLHPQRLTFSHESMSVYDVTHVNRKWLSVQCPGRAMNGACEWVKNCGKSYQQSSALAYISMGPLLFTSVSCMGADIIVLAFFKFFTHFASARYVCLYLTIF